MRSFVHPVCLTFSLIATGAGALVAAPPMPPLKTGLWESRTTARDASGKEVLPPEQAALANMPPEARARMAEMMKGRGIPMPDATGAIKMCLTKELLEAGRFQQMAADGGCTTTYSTQTATTWKWHSSCSAMHVESDGEAVFTDTSIRNTITSTVTANGQTSTTTRLSTSKWLAADCGDVKPVDPSLFSGKPQRPGR
ncbi:MAG: DUF3617 domain-containing protein [Acidobacteria bacterium]|nr:DUF3617 domain-containing protein [Acidobacteriota bacterium]